MEPEENIQEEPATAEEIQAMAAAAKKKVRYKDFNEEHEAPRAEIPDLNDFDEDEIFARMAMGENIFNTRGLSKAPNSGQTPGERYLQMGRCAQMHSYQWSNLFSEMSRLSDFPIVQVRFKNTHKDFFRLPENENPQDFQTGDIVITESANGHDTGTICLRGELVRLQLKKKNLAPDSDQIKKIVRKARPNDIDKWVETIQAEKEMQRKARIIAAQLGLSMKINNVEIQGDFTKAIFYYTADDRVDFRQLIKLYAEEFKLRIEMRQIGARQESGILGGIGSCGRELCCVSFLHNFSSVSTHAARVQQISLNPQKLAGQCSKLKCCLNYEYDVYMDAMKSMPDTSIQLLTENGEAHCVKSDPMKRTLTYAYKDVQGFVELSADNVFEIIERNRRGETVPDLVHFITKTVSAPEPQPEFQQVVGQDDLTRFDKPKKKEKTGGPSKKNTGIGKPTLKGQQISKPISASEQPHHEHTPAAPSDNKPAHSAPRQARTLQKPILKKKNDNEGEHPVQQ